MNENSIEDDLRNFWEFVKLESRRLTLLERKVATIEKTLSEILENDRQRFKPEETDE